MSRLLIVVDFQKDFVDGALGFDGAAALDAKIAAKVREYLAAGDEVVYTMDTHGPEYLQTQEGRRLPVAHCLRGEAGWQPFGETGRLLSGEAQCRSFEKPTFGSGELFDWLRRQPDFESIELCGLVSNICVLSNAVLAKCAQPEARIVVDAGCTDSFDRELHQAAMAVLAGIQIDIVNG